MHVVAYLGNGYADLQDNCPHREDETVTSGLRTDHPTFNGLETNIEDFLNKTNFNKYN